MKVTYTELFFSEGVVYSCQYHITILKGGAILLAVADRINAPRS